jgi:peptide/nickel transport system permease protein
MLVYVVGFSLQWLPIYGGYTAGSIPQWSLAFAIDVLEHAILPSLAIILGSIGFWALGMRAMMVTNLGEDHVVFAEAKGLQPRTIFLHYGVRNAMLPQATALALILGQLVSGAVLVEIIFGYPGIGTVLFQAIKGSDFFVVQGIVFILIIAIGLATLILDLVYPLLDPRIVYRRS